MNIKFANGTNFEYLNAIETEEYYNGASRRTLTFECKVGVISVDELNRVLSNEANTKNITLTSDPMPVYKTETITTTGTDENGEPIQIKQEVEVKDESGEPVIDHYEYSKNIYDGYVLKCKCGIENKLISAETPESLAVYEDKLIFKLGRRTFVEEYLHNQGF